MAAIEQIREKFESGELNYKKTSEICRVLGLCSRNDREAISRILKQMESDGEIVRDERGRYVCPQVLGLLRGTIQGNERGFAFLLREDGPDLFIPHRSLHGALHGDLVFVRLIGGEHGDEAAVYSVIHRGLTELVGTYYRDRKGGMVEPDERRFSEAVRIVGGREKAVSGEKVLIRIIAYPDGKYPEGEVLEILGQSGNLETEEEAIIRSHGLPEKFAAKVTDEAVRAAREPLSVAGRRDFRAQSIITIDGEDSRDFDDAVYVERDGDSYRLEVHIADVSYYVRRGGAIDREAYTRGTSVYFPDRVLPMLPQVLSNGICSLNEGEDRYTLSCLMRIDASGNVEDSELVFGMIRSVARMTYTKVTAILNGDELLRTQYASLVPMLEEMRDLATILGQKRTARGSIDLDMREAGITLSDGRICIEPIDRTISHRMIEEFMILANETVASFMEAYEMPFLYRVHEKPTQERAEGFKAYLQELGVRANFRPDNVRPSEYRKILESMSESSLRRIVNGVMLRSMAKARYSAENIGHFGIASPCYCHFTSPIRRYPDLVVHRLVRLVLEGRAVEAEEQYRKFVSVAAIDCSANERRADEAERAVDDLYKTWYMREHLGEEFDGIIAGVTAFGIFVELPNTVEGIVKIENLPADDYVFVEKSYLLHGRNRNYRIGDPIRVLVASCDIGARRCEFVPVMIK